MSAKEILEKSTNKEEIKMNLLYFQKIEQNVSVEITSHERESAPWV